MANATNRILWWSLVVSLLVYVVVAHVASVPPNAQAPPVGILVAAFGAISVGIAIGTIIYRRHALSDPIQRGDLDPTSPEGQGRAFTPFILNLVLSESLGIYGLVLAFLTAEGAYSLPFVLAALVLMYVHRPTAPDLVPPSSGRGAPIS